MTRFALLHGGQHGGWCWERVQRELHVRGFDSVAPDLPMEDPRAGAREWADSVTGALGSPPGDVIVVAHSLSGLALPLVAATTGARRQVYLSACVPQPGLRYADYLATDEGATSMLMPITVARDGEEVRGECTWATARHYFYPDCSEDDARWAWNRLRRRATTVFTEPPTIAAWPDVPATFVVMSDDRCVNPAWSRRMAARMGADVIELPGGHSPFLSFPALLAEHLVAVARTRVA